MSDSKRYAKKKCAWCGMEVRRSTAAKGKSKRLYCPSGACGGSPRGRPKEPTS